MSVALSPEHERRLIQRLKRRDSDAMMELYDSYSRLLYSIVLRAVNNAAIAEDITQEVFLRVWNRVRTFDENKGNLEGWLVTVARNRAFDYLRSVRNAPDTSSISLTDLERSPLFAAGRDSSPDRQLAARAVREALRDLTDDQRQVMELTHFEGLTQTEIAGQLKKPLGTVKGLVRSALKSLRAALVTKGALSPDLHSGEMEAPSEGAK
jgi:RNA polymerase sigma-70 factor (ECF subfamily)